MVPKVQRAHDIESVSAQLASLEAQANLPVGSIGIEVQIEDALGLINVEAIAASDSRIQTLVFGPADFMASINMRSLIVGAQPDGYTEGDAYHYVLMRLLIAGRAFGKQVIDGPYLGIKDSAGLRTASFRSAALGLDGKWVLHPDQIAIVNEIFSPAQDDFDHAELILEAYDYYTSHDGGARGAVMLGEQMIDEASRKMALVISAKGRAAGLQRTTKFEPVR
jgi:citrate lyase subunit beta/citryl-CoA lyase